MADTQEMCAVCKIRPQGSVAWAKHEADRPHHLMNAKGFRKDGSVVLVPLCAQCRVGDHSAIVRAIEAHGGIQ